MTRLFPALSAIALLSACGGGETTTDTADGGDATEAASEAIMLDNGVPAYEGFDASAIEESEQDGDTHKIRYLIDADAVAAYEFYRNHYQNAGYELVNGGVTFRSDDPAYGGYVQLFTETDQTMVHVSPKAGSGEYDLESTLGDGFPTYGNVNDDGYDVNERSDGSRLVIFRTPDAADDILQYYRAAGTDAGYETSNLSLEARNSEERVKIAIFAIDAGLRINTETRAVSE